MIVIPAALIAGGAVTAALLGVFGGDDGSDGAARSEDTAAEDRTEAEESYNTCRRQIGPLLDELQELDSRLDVGLSYDEYTTHVGDARVIYDRVVDEVDDTTCLTEVGLPAERAFNQYVKASNKWGDCFEDLDCDPDAIEPTLQTHWDRASTLVESADRRLEAMRTP
jgi:hypothetical protein